MAIKVRKRREDDEPPEDEENGEPEATEAQLEDEDPFVAGSMRTLQWLSEHPNVIVGFLIAIAVAGAAVYGGLNYMRSQAVAASSGVSGALTAVQTPVDGSPEMQALTSSDRAASPKTTFESDKERWTAVFDRAGKTLDNYADSQAAQAARITQAAAAIRLEKYDKAIELYQAYLDADAGKDKLPTVHYGRAVALAEKGQYDKAMKALDALMNLDDSYKSFARYHKGMFMEEAGNPKKAKNFYDKVLDNNPQTPYKSAIERRRALL